MIIAVSGNMGSGKTTLAKQLVEMYDFVYIPHEKKYTYFLNDFFNDFEKFFLPTQLSFIISKAVEIKQLSDKGKNIIIDRSLIEDIYIFATYWMENITIEERIKDIFFQLQSTSWRLHRSQVHIFYPYVLLTYVKVEYRNDT